MFCAILRFDVHEIINRATTPELGTVLRHYGERRPCGVFGVTDESLDRESLRRNATPSIVVGRAGGQ
jgi:hypothetical protein